MTDFVDFELEIERWENQYRARVRKAPVERVARSTFDLPLEADLEGFAAEVIRSRSVSRDLRPDPAFSLEAGELGRQLFEKVFTGDVREIWHGSVAIAGASLRLRLRLEDDPHLLSIPWELLFDPEGDVPIAIERPLIRSLEIQSHRDPLIVDGPLRILTVLSCPSDAPRIDLRKEWGKLDEALGEEADLHRVQPRLPEVDRALRKEQWHVLHFVGHGEVDERGGALILEDAEGISRSVDHARIGMFLGHESLRLIVLNACEGATPGPNAPFSGVAQSLIKRKVPAVLAMQRPVSDDAAIAFAEAFYSAMAELPSVDLATLKARRALFQEHEAKWFAPVLYLSARDGRIFIPPPPQPPPPPGPWPWIAATVVLVLGLATWLWLREPDQVVKGLLQPSPPRGEEGNPKECPSPKGLDIAFERVPPGIFEMGQKGGAKDDEPVHRVRVVNAFCLGAYEITQEQWHLVMGKTETKSEERYFPAQRVTFDGAQEFIRKMNQGDPSSPYRLPTEAEWEYAARAGTKTIYSFGDDPEALSVYANCGEDRERKNGPVPVGRFRPNEWGFFDMYGNVFEWVLDGYAPYSETQAEDPRPPAKGIKRIRRGGSWESRAAVCNSAARSAVIPAWRRQENGFRIVREIR